MREGLPGVGGKLKVIRKVFKLNANVQVIQHEYFRLEAFALTKQA